MHAPLVAYLSAYGYCSFLVIVMVVAVAMIFLFIAVVIVIGALTVLTNGTSKPK